MANKNKLIILFTMLIIGILIFIFEGVSINNADYLLSKRLLKLIAVIISGGAIAISAMFFQIIFKNRILTPGVLGMDSVYSFVQTFIVFIFQGAIIGSKKLTFILSLIGMMAVSMLMYKLILKNKKLNLMLLLLVGLVFSTFFSSITSFMQVLIDPNEYLTLQSKLLASFNSVNTDIILISSVILLLLIPYIYNELKYLDVLVLGKEQAINLGVNYDRATKKLLISVVILSAVSTALVGPLTFLGLIVVNITYEMFKTFRHKTLIFASILISIIAIVFSLLLVERVFEFSTTIGIIINFIGGIYFLFLIFSQRKI